MFTYEYYRSMIGQLLETGYSFGRFDGLEARPHTIYLRHDVDFDLWGSIELGNIERRCGVNSIFFFQPNAELYNIFSKECLRIIERLSFMGHEIGIHIDAAIFDDRERLYEYIRNTYTYYSGLLPITKTISFHRPSPFVLNSAIHLDGFINVYDQRYFKDIAYISDSNRRNFWMQDSWKDALNAKKSMQLLTHPIWWGSRDYSVSETRDQYVKKYVSYCNRALARSSKAFDALVKG